MKPLYLSLFIVFSACAPKTPATIEQAAPLELPSPESLFERNLEVSNYATAIEGLENLTVHSTMRIPAAGIEGEMTTRWMLPNHILVEQNIPGIGAGKVGYNGEVAWSSDNMMGPRLIEGQELEELLMDSQLDSELKYKYWYPEMRTVGLVDFRGQQAYQVDATTSFGRKDTKYFDAESGFNIGASHEVQSPLGAMTMTIVFSQWGDIDGMTMPKLTLIETGPVTIETEILSLERNGELADTLFELPPEIQELWTEAQATEPENEEGSEPSPNPQDPTIDPAE